MESGGGPVGAPWLFLPVGNRPLGLGSLGCIHGGIPSALALALALAQDREGQLVAGSLPGVFQGHAVALGCVPASALALALALAQGRVVRYAYVPRYKSEYLGRPKV